MHNLESDISSFLKHKLDGRTINGDPAKLMEELKNFLELERAQRQPEQETAPIRHLHSINRPNLRVVT